MKTHLIEMKYYIKRMYKRGIIINSIEPMIEDTVFLIAPGIISLYYQWFCIGAFELFGLGIGLAIIDEFRTRRERIKVSLLLTLLVIPLAFLMFSLAQTFTNLLNNVRIYGCFTIMSIASLYLLDYFSPSIYARVERYLCNVPYITFTTGVTIDVISNISGNSVNGLAIALDDGVAYGVVWVALGMLSFGLLMSLLNENYLRFKWNKLILAIYFLLIAGGIIKLIPIDCAFFFIITSIIFSLFIKKLKYSRGEEVVERDS